MCGGGRRDVLTPSLLCARTICSLTVSGTSERRNASADTFPPAELRDPELLPHLLKANPHKATYSNMMLFLRSQVEAYAFSAAKWGSEEGLDAEFDRREEEKAKKRGKKFAAGLKELRRRTMNNVWQQRKDEEHVHVWQESAEGDSQTCECGAVIDVEVF